MKEKEDMVRNEDRRRNVGRLVAAKSKAGRVNGPGQTSRECAINEHA